MHQSSEVGPWLIDDFYLTDFLLFASCVCVRWKLEVDFTYRTYGLVLPSSVFLSEPQQTTKSQNPSYYVVPCQCHDKSIMRRPIIAIFAAVASVSFAQDYGDSYADYADGQEDNLYANYAAKHQAKEV